MGLRQLGGWAFLVALVGGGCGGAVSPNPPLSTPTADAGLPPGAPGGPPGAPATTSVSPGSDGGSDRRRFAGDASSAAGDAAPAPGFSDLFATIFLPTCSGGDCHNPGARGDVSVLTELNAYNSLVRFVSPGDPAGSRLTQILGSGEMPRGGPRLSSTELADITAWIERGALND